MRVGWLSATDEQVPAGDGWLSPDERRVQAGLRFEPRRHAWRLGRWVAKQAVAAELGVRSELVSVHAASDGAPEPFVAGERAPLTLSISHRAGRGLAVVGPAEVPVGADLELIEPRSPGFVADWFATAEQDAIRKAPSSDRVRLVCLHWAAKEAASKVVRQGLRLDLRRVVVALPESTRHDGWCPWRATMPAGVATAPASIEGWWRRDGELLVTVATMIPCGPPRAIGRP
jgi:4'-phosphopantetheinyl transferase